MAALNIFKKTEQSANAATTNVSSPRVTGNSRLVRPHITEKATDLAAKNQYVFVVESGASKKEIGRSVEKAYGVNVLGVRVINVRPKATRLGRQKGVKKGYKKAIVQVQKGQRIEILPT